MLGKLNDFIWYKHVQKSCDVFYPFKCFKIHRYKTDEINAMIKIYPQYQWIYNKLSKYV
jgi:hypothetical protein